MTGLCWMCEIPPLLCAPYSEAVRRGALAVFGSIYMTRGCPLSLRGYRSINKAVTALSCFPPFELL